MFCLDDLKGDGMVSRGWVIEETSNLQNAAISRKTPKQREVRCLTRWISGVQDGSGLEEAEACRHRPLTPAELGRYWNWREDDDEDGLP